MGRYKKEAGLAYGAMFIATLAQLMVPQLVQNILDAITDGMVASKILELPAQVQTIAAERLGLNIEQLTLNRDNSLDAML